MSRSRVLGGAAVEAAVVRRTRYRRECEVLTAVARACGVSVHYTAHVRIRRSLAEIEDVVTGVDVQIERDLLPQSFLAWLDEASDREEDLAEELARDALDRMGGVAFRGRRGEKAVVN